MLHHHFESSSPSVCMGESGRQLVKQGRAAQRRWAAGHLLDARHQQPGGLLHRSTVAPAFGLRHAVFDVPAQPNQAEDYVVVDFRLGGPPWLDLLRRPAAQGRQPVPIGKSGLPPLWVLQPERLSGVNVAVSS